MKTYKLKKRTSEAGVSHRNFASGNKQDEVCMLAATATQNYKRKPLSKAAEGLTYHKSNT